MRLLVAVSNEPLAHAIHGALLAGRHEVSLASTGSIALAAVALIVALTLVRREPAPPAVVAASIAPAPI